MPQKCSFPAKLKSGSISRAVNLFTFTTLLNRISQNSDLSSKNNNNNKKNKHTKKTSRKIPPFTVLHKSVSFPKILLSLQRVSLVSFQ